MVGNLYPMLAELGIRPSTRYSRGKPDITKDDYLLYMLWKNVLYTIDTKSHLADNWLVEVQLTDGAEECVTLST
ncbi:hypothetical protein J6590_026125 [Homalodisca vitripennis]|nr:hypothetical protein J6590_026125 [Homalodisca vitripennis]